MSRTVKLLIGLVAALLVAWLQHGPLGAGEALVGRLEDQARSAVATSEVPGVGVEFPRDPLSRTAILAGPANDFQRRGMGEMPGLTGLVESIEGVAKVRWADDPATGGNGIPLIVEVLAAAALAWLVGLGIGWVLFGRRKRESYL